eukprot:Em0003g130a
MSVMSVVNPKCNCCKTTFRPASPKTPTVCVECAMWSTRSPNPNRYPIDDKAEWSFWCDCCRMRFRQSYYGLRYVQLIRFACGDTFYICKDCSSYGNKRCPTDKDAKPLECLICKKFGDVFLAEYNCGHKMYLCVPCHDEGNNTCRTCDYGRERPSSEHQFNEARFSF